ncbi:serine hydrolase domain-containing protein [Cellulomonas sp. 179-A 4D5 NHS]|uniref:serine hydrolase domain-containing protein n=1 Tax=Cellulomonas sp. 179-A 4D5 NHS TaxID=3142378 RepID=UPI0039A2D288
MSRGIAPRTSRASRPVLGLALGSVLLSLVAACGGPEQLAAQTAAGKGAASDEVLRELLAERGPGCSAAVAREGEVVWAGARGLADVERGEPITETTAFDFASVSKQFTAIAVLQLAEEGALALTDPLSQHLPALPGWAGSVTLDDLLHHTSGIPDYTGLLTEAGTTPDEPADQASAVAAIAALAEVETTGTFAYSNSNYVLLAEVVAAVSGRDLASVLQTSVFGDVSLRLQPAPRGADVAVPYVATGTDWRPTPSSWTQVGDGSIVGSPTNLVAWADLYRSDVDLRQQMTEGAVDTGAPDGTRYGRGIVVAPDGSLSHAGGWSGYSSLFGMTGDYTTAIAVSCNADDLPIAQVAEALRDAWT